MDELLSNIGTRLRTAREALGLSQEAVAARAQLNTSYLSQIERGRKMASLEVLMRLSGAVNLSLGELFADREGTSAPPDLREMERLVASVPEAHRPALLELVRAAAELASR